MLVSEMHRFCYKFECRDILEEEFHEDSCAATPKNGFKKIKIWSDMRYEMSGKLIILSEKKGEGKIQC